MGHIVHVERVSIRDLHLKTGDLVRRAALGEGVVVTDRGRPLASIIPVRPGDLGTPFGDRRTLPEFDALPATDGDSTTYVSDDRERSYESSHAAGSAARNSVSNRLASARVAATFGHPLLISFCLAR